jgi:valyl-tRNA synthetase
MTNDERRSAVQRTLWYVLSNTMKLLHPIMPFLTEEVWQQLPHDGDSIMVAAWPTPHLEWIDTQAEADIEVVMDAVRRVRGQRVDLGISPTQILRIHLRQTGGGIPNLREIVKYTARLSRSEALEEVPVAGPVGRRYVEEPAAGFSLLTEIEDKLVPSARERLSRELQEIGPELGRLERRLADQEFMTRAPADVVQRERARLVELQARQRRLQELLAALEVPSP